MNDTRRKGLREVSEMLNEAIEALEVFLEEEQNYIENVPENLQGSEKYELAELAVDELEEAIDNIKEAVDNIDSASGG